MTKTCGNVLSEYGLILALISVAGIAAFLPLGQNIVANLTSLKDGIVIKPAPKAIKQVSSPSTPTSIDTVASSLGGTISAPVESCIGSACTVDFGNVKITGIPSDFNAFVETAGAAGGVGAISSMYAQLGQQVEEMGLAEESLALKKLSSYAHNIAVIETYYENIVNSCVGTTSCPDGDTIISSVPGYDETFAPYPSWYGDKAPDQKNLFWGSVLATATVQRNNDPEAFKKKLNMNFPSQLFADEIDTLMNDPDLPENIKGVAKQLAYDIGVISEDFKYNYQNTKGTYEAYCKPFAPHCTNIPPEEKNYGLEIDDYNASKLNHFNAALMCAAGNHKDSGTKCN